MTGRRAQTAFIPDGVTNRVNRLPTAVSSLIPQSSVRSAFSRHLRIEGVAPKSESGRGMVPRRLREIMLGEPDQAIERLAYAMRSKPLDSEMYRMQCGTALAHLFAGRFDEAGPLGRECVERLADLSYRHLRTFGESCARGPNGRSAASNAQPTPRASPLQSQGLALIPPSGISHHLV